MNSTKPMTNRAFALMLAAATLVAGLMLPANASAQEVQVTGPLAGAPAVRHMRLYREGRFMLEPNFSFTFQDEYSRSMIVGMHLGYYFTDWIGIGAWGGYNVAGIDTPLTGEITNGGVTTSRNALSLPNRENFPDQIGQLTWMAHLQLEFIPLRGKLAMFQKVFVDTDFYIFAGAGFVGVDERADIDVGEIAACSNMNMGTSPACLTALQENQVARQSRVAFAPTFGFGLQTYINGIVGLNFNYRAMPFAYNTSGTDEGSTDDADQPDNILDGNDRFLKLNQMFTFGVVILLPTEPHVTE